MRKILIFFQFIIFITNITFAQILKTESRWIDIRNIEKCKLGSKIGQVRFALGEPTKIISRHWDDSVFVRIDEYIVRPIGYPKVPGAKPPPNLSENVTKFWIKESSYNISVTYRNDILHSIKVIPAK